MDVNMCVIEKTVSEKSLPGLKGRGNLPERLAAAAALLALKEGLEPGEMKGGAFVRKCFGDVTGLPVTMDGDAVIRITAEEGRVKEVAFNVKWGAMEPKAVEPKEDGTPRERDQWRTERLNPQRYRVEYRAQFADSAYAYFDPQLVKACFDTNLKEQMRFTPGIAYRVHCDPGRVNDYFSLMVAHAEGDLLIEDKALVFRPEDCEGHTLDYLKIEEALRGILEAFRPVSMTFDQYNSAYLIDALNSYASQINLDCQIGEETATKAKNRDMYENLKLLINQGKVKCYQDRLNIREKDRCLLEASLCKVEIANGKIFKPREPGYGHLDLVDCLAVLGIQLSDDMAGDGIDYSQMVEMGVSQW